MKGLGEDEAAGRKRNRRGRRIGESVFQKNLGGGNTEKRSLATAGISSEESGGEKEGSVW